MTVDIKPGVYSCAANSENNITLVDFDSNGLLETAVLFEIEIPELKAKCPNMGAGCPNDCKLGNLFINIEQNYNELTKGII